MKANLVESDRIKRRQEYDEFRLLLHKIARCKLLTESKSEVTFWINDSLMKLREWALNDHHETQ